MSDRPTGDRRSHRAQAAGAWLAGRVARAFDSWLFIVAQTAVAVVWAVVNRVTPEDRWMPGLLLDLALILGPQAAYAAPLVLFSRIRLADAARIDARPRLEV
ncbi:DUF1003 domain-containing protein [Yinghuangia soli]|uniref:DUF1003 domain-containing protein n=1 Tax=Yinghuangia soli TaxID=2908204 RepID=A0AA41Q1J7_9ACTN|nr:DUF1003 domain-containing protein [Yinghuangia soli]MCF2529250.1 DUF1003 domain-containing protein [Yinghuangia soli]